MIRRAAALAVAIAVCLPGHAESDPGEDPTAHANGDSFYVTSAERTTAERKSTQHPASQNAAPSTPTLLLGMPGCAGADQVADAQSGAGLPVTFCPAPDPTTAQPVLTLAMIRSAFAALRLPPSTLVVQPPDGLTLVNFDTNFYTRDTFPITRTVTLLGQRVTLEATPSSYRWEFGDGEARTTSEPGAPYPRLDVTHSYLRTGTYRPRLATTYTGRYRVAGAGWRTIPGTVTIEGAAQPLRAIEAVPKLVPYE